jgi:hypothetical protein
MDSVRAEIIIKLSPEERTDNHLRHFNKPLEEIYKMTKEAAKNKRFLLIWKLMHQ